MATFEGPYAVLSQFGGIEGARRQKVATKAEIAPRLAKRCDNSPNASDNDFCTEIKAQLCLGLESIILHASAEPGIKREST